MVGLDRGRLATGRMVCLLRDGTKVRFRTRKMYRQCTVSLFGRGVVCMYLLFLSLLVCGCLLRAWR